MRTATWSPTPTGTTSTSSIRPPRHSARASSTSSRRSSWGADAGYDAVEIDNLDTFDRFDQLDVNGAMALASAYVEIAHKSGLAIAQKNAAETTTAAHEDLGFDFAVAEECAVHDECAAYTSVYGPHVLQIEYPDSLEDAGMTFADACALPDRAPLMILRDRGLVAQGVEEYRFESC